MTHITLMISIAMLIALTYSAPTLNILDFGAKGDGKTMDTMAINKAIQTCAMSNGCTLIFPTGYKFLTAPFNITSNMEFHVQKDAFILASQNVSDWHLINPLPSYCQGRELPGPRYCAFMGGNNLTNVKITGGGVIDGQGHQWWQMFKNKTLLFTRGHLMEFQYCENFEISHIRLVNSPFWTVHPYVCNNVLVDSIEIMSPVSSPNTDGVDPDSSSNVIIRDSLIAGGDDNIAIKSGWDYCGRQFGVPSVNITVERCIFPWGQGMAVGSETSGGVYNVTFRNCTVGPDCTDAAIHIKTGRGRGGTISNVTYEDIIIAGSNLMLKIDMNYTGGPPTNRTATPFLKDVKIHNVVGVGLHDGGFWCLPESHCEVCMKNVGVVALASKQEWSPCNYVDGQYKDVEPSASKCFVQSSKPCS